MILTLFHDQSAIEQGFSINTELLVKNHAKTSIIKQRIVYNHYLPSEKKSHEFPISNKIINSCKWYNAALEDKIKI